MTLVAAACAHGSPGVSTAVQLIAAQWAESSVVPVIVEADASGGVLAARYELSLTPGFVTLAESLRKFEAPPLLDHAQRLPSGVAGVPLSPSATAAGAQLRSAGPYLGSYLASAGGPVLLDAGTAIPDGKIAPVLSAADLLLWFARPTREELLVLRHRLAECPQPDDVAIVLVGKTPYDAVQVADALETEVLHTLPVDRRAADAVNLGGDDRYLRRSQLARSCRNLAARIAERTAEPIVADAAAEPPAGERPGAAQEVIRADPPTTRSDGGCGDADGDDLVVWVPDANPG